MNQLRFSAYTLLFLLFSSLSFGQIHIMRLVPINTLNFEGDSLQNFEIIDYNNDEHPDYYLATHQKAYLFNGENLDLLWNGPQIDNFNYQNLEYIESLEVWRNFLIERINSEIIEITWIDLPEGIEAGPITLNGEYFENDWFSNIFVSYVAFNDFETVFAQLSTSLAVPEAGWSYGLGLAYTLDGYIRAEFGCGRSLDNRTFHYSDQIYLWHFGNLYEWWQDIFGNFLDRYWGQTIIYNSDFSEVRSYQSYNGLTKSCDFYNDNENIAPKQLLAGEDNIILYNDIFDDSTFLTYSPNYGISCPQFFIFENELKILVGSVTGRFEMLDLDLSLFRPFPDQYPGGIQDIHTEDIDNDGTDEVFCIYNSHVVICSVEEGVGVDDPSTPLPEFYITSYPNPFNATTVIKYELPQQSQVTIEIYDILGRKVTTLIDKQQPAGYHQAIWHADEFSSGMYFYKLTAGDYNETKKMLLLK